MSRRIQRINELLRQEISQLFLRQLDFSGALVTITQVETSPNLRQARIKFSVLPNNKSEQVLNIIKKNIFDLQQALNKRLQMRPVPKMIFEIDQGQVNAQRMEEIFDKMKKG